MLPREVVQMEIGVQSQQKGTAAVFCLPRPQEIPAHETLIPRRVSVFVVTQTQNQIPIKIRMIQAANLELTTQVMTLHDLLKSVSGPNATWGVRVAAEGELVYARDRGFGHSVHTLLAELYTAGPQKLSERGKTVKRYEIARKLARIRALVATDPDPRALEDAFSRLWIDVVETFCRVHRIWMFDGELPLESIRDGYFLDLLAKAAKAVSPRSRLERLEETVKYVLESIGGLPDDQFIMPTMKVDRGRLFVEED